MEHGALCLSTAARERSPLPVHALPALVALLAVAAMAGAAPGLGRRAGRRRPRPPGGRSLLLQVAVART